MCDSDGRDKPVTTLGDLLYPDRSDAAIPERDWVRLLEAIGTGDQPALRALYERSHRIVFTLVMRICAQREMADERKYAALPVVRDLLAVADNLELAIQAAEKDPGAAKVLEGVKMVASQLEAVLKQHHCVRIETVGAPFDPNQHEAISQEASDQHPAGTVTRAVQSGYKLYDRVIRPAQVFVSTGPGGQNDQ